jgi:hypothetical protein
MKLPGINYSTPVRSLGREDSGAPVRLAAAETQTLQQLSKTAGQIYNKVQEQQAVDYWADTERQLNEIETDFKTRPATSDKALKEEFDSRVAAIKGKANEDLSGAANRMWSNRFSNSVNKARFRTTTSNALVLAKQQRTNSEDALNELAKGDLEAALKGLRDSPLFSDAEKKQKKEDFIFTYENSQIEQALTSKDAGLIQANIIRLESGQSVLQGRELRQSLGWLNSAFNEATAGDRAKLARAKELAASKLARCVDSGNCGPAQIQTGFDNEIISGLKRTELLRKVDKLQKKNIGIANRSATLSLYEENNLPLNPGNKDHRLAVEEEYGRRESQIQQIADPMEQAIAYQALSEWGIKTATLNIFPKQMMDNLNSFALSGSPQNAAGQANIYKALQANAPQAITGLSMTSKSFYNSTALLMRGGLSAEDAVKTARENINLPPEIKAGFSQRYATDAASTVKDRLTNFYEAEPFDIGWGPFDEPEPTPAEIMTFGAIEKMFYLKNGGDINAASKSAINEFKTIFAGSRLGNPDGDIQAMPYSPDKMFPTIDPGDLRKDITAFAEKHKLPNPANAFVRAHANTAREQLKTYEVWMTDDAGNIEPATSKLPGKSFGMPLTWTPELKDVRAEQLTEAKKSIESDREAADLSGDDGLDTIEDFIPEL